MVGVWQTYDGQIKEMRDEGQTLQDIGNQIGVSRERVRQILVQRYGAADVGKDLYIRNQLQKLLGRGIPQRLLPEPVIGGFYPKYTIGALQHIVEQGYHKCKNPVCNNYVWLKKYCSMDCHNDFWKNYDNWSSERKAKHRQCVKSWMERHPERTREIMMKANLKQRERTGFEGAKIKSVGL